MNAEILAALNEIKLQQAKSELEIATAHRDFWQQRVDDGKAKVNELEASEFVLGILTEATKEGI